MVLPLYFDVVNRYLIKGPTNPDRFLAGNLYQEDTYYIDFRAYTPTGQRFGTIYSPVSLAGHSLVISVGSAGVPNAAGIAWATSADSYTLSGALEMNTAGINGLAAGASQTLEVCLSSISGKIKGQQSVSIVKGVYTSAAVVPVASDVSIGRSEALRLFALKEGRPGEAIILTSLLGRQIQIYFDDTLGFQTPNIN